MSDRPHAFALLKQKEKYFPQTVYDSDKISIVYFTLNCVSIFLDFSMDSRA